MKIVSRFAALPRRARVAAVAAGVLIVFGAVSVPVTAVAVDQHNRQLASEVAAEKQAAGDRKAAAALAEAKAEAARLNGGFDGLTTALGNAVHADAAAAFEAARVALAFAIADGDHDDVSAAVDAVDEALRALATSAGAQAEALTTASPLAGTSRDALAKAVAELATADDLVDALTRVKAASDQVVAAQKAGKAAADAAAAAAKQRAEEEAAADAWEEEPATGGDATGGYSAEHPFDPAILGMEPGERGDCGENPTGQVVTMDMSWQAREGDTVDIYYALTESPDRATGGFTQLVSGGAESGSVTIPITCPVGSGPGLSLTVKAVARNPNGSADAYYWGL
ncbi:hypothetical protein MUN74_05190 [Agromyces endophyticus]|uniref:hypothetical protein n=1 Tax=Agromyces sp. H17E-10 TaxID=2932244 RepID=UPI001FD4B1CB|nr:hypothetical protein [Agromyces sp. H17E-10]UOQ90318.1 hypothetical protein MUN74_05190 [Agromyces sp. H17E-10]